MLDALDAAAVRRWCDAAVGELAAHRDEIDRLNVFPVADRDTGSNLLLTLQAAAAELGGGSGSDAPVGALLTDMARGALLGARGNSGLILGSLLRGAAESLDGARSCGPDGLRRALRRGATSARAAVHDPVEGTALSVADAAADAADRTSPDAPLDTVVRAAAAGARTALARTPDQLAPLGAAGVVDAGGRGVVALLDALETVVGGSASPAAPVAGPSPVPADAADGGRAGGPAYEVAYLLASTERAVDRLRTALSGLGDSLVVAPAGPDTWSVHVHVDDVGAALEAGVDAGRPHRITVTRFNDGRRPSAAGAAAASPSTHDGGRVVVVVDAGAGLGPALTAAGVLHGGADDVLSVARTAGAAEAVVVAGGPHAGPAAAAAAAALRADGLAAVVVPTRSPVQALAAAAVADATRPFADDAVAIAEAAAAVRWGELVVATEDGLTSAGPCRAGDVLGLVEDDVAVVGADSLEVATAVLERMLLSSGEMVTVVTGPATPAGAVAALTRAVRRYRPEVDVASFAGQPDGLLLLGVE